MLRRICPLSPGLDRCLAVFCTNEIRAKAGLTKLQKSERSFFSDKAPGLRRFQLSPLFRPLDKAGYSLDLNRRDYC